MTAAVVGWIRPAGFFGRAAEGEEDEEDDEGALAGNVDSRKSCHM